MKIDGSVAHANKISVGIMKNAVKDAGLHPSDLAGLFDVDEDTVKGWFTSTVPYDVFLQLCKITHVKAIDVFNETKTILKAERAAAKASGSHDGDTVKTPSGDHPRVESKSDQPAASTSNQASESDVDLDGKPDDLPFPLLKTSAADVGLKNADALILEWDDVKREAIDLRSDLSDDQKQSRLKKYPKPSKMSSDKVELIFPSYKAAQGFVNGGYLNNVNEIAARRQYGVTITVRDHEDH